MKMILVLALALTPAIHGCATPESPQQAVFQAKSSYAVALTAAVAYKRLPDCVGAPQPCSSAPVVSQLQKADNVAASALDAAESAVRTPGFGESIVASAVGSAKAALAAFLSITATLGAR